MANGSGEAMRGMISRRALFRLRPQRTESRRVAQWAHACLEARGIACRACEGVCERGALGFRPGGNGCARPNLATATCDGCGACVARCPVGALELASVVLEAS